MNPFGRGPRDEDGAACARVLLSPSAQRDRLTAGVYLPSDPAEPLGRVERALRLASEAAPILDRIRQASRAGRLEKAAPETLLEPARGAGIVSPAEVLVVEAAVAARRDAIAVDSFSPEEYFGGAPAKPAPAPSADEMLAGR
jgi:acyl-CoA dehydrogenase